MIELALCKVDVDGDDDGHTIITLILYIYVLRHVYMVVAHSKVSMHGKSGMKCNYIHWTTIDTIYILTIKVK